jgi:hypothetical protein
MYGDGMYWVTGRSSTTKRVPSSNLVSRKVVIRAANLSKMLAALPPPPAPAPPAADIIQWVSIFLWVAQQAKYVK